MRRTLTLLACLALAACSKVANQADTRVVDNGAGAGRDIKVTTAPGVAFAYTYSFQLPPTHITAAQEQHQQACERLGLSRCRITGWRYQVVGENDIQGTLSVLLDPTIARAFGKEAIADIIRQNGSLRQAEITGTNVADAIRSGRTGHLTAQVEIARIDRELARADLKSAERAELQGQRSISVEHAHEATGIIAANEASLATTPMTFDYRSGASIRGFDASAPIASAVDLLLGSAHVTFAFVLSAIALLGPPALALLLIGLAVWAVRRRFPRSS